MGPAAEDNAGAVQQAMLDRPPARRGFTDLLGPRNPDVCRGKNLSLTLENRPDKLRPAMNSPVYKTTPHEWGLHRPSRIDQALLCSPDIHVGAGRAG